MIAKLLVILYFVQDIHGVQIVEFSVPEQVVRGEDITLICKYDLGSNRLYSVKWTKGPHDFYTFKYLTSGQAKKEVYSVPGINVDEKASTDSTVHLRNIQLSATGLIKCEVTAEKSFITDYNEQFLTVLDIPGELPTISPPLAETYNKPGDRVTLRCESAPSYPAANITWLINGEPVSRPMVTHDPVRKLHRGPDTLELASSSLNFVIQESQFHNGQIRVVCEAKITDKYMKAVEYLAYKEGYTQRMLGSTASSHLLSGYITNGLVISVYFIFRQRLS